MKIDNSFSVFIFPPLPIHATAYGFLLKLDVCVERSAHLIRQMRAGGT